MKPAVVSQIEQLFSDGFTLNLPKNALDPIRGVMGAQQDYPKYAVNQDGELVGLNLAYTELDDAKWQAVAALLDRHQARLQALALNDNALTTFSLTPSLSNLSYLDIDDNPLESPPEEIRKQGPKAVLRFLRELQEQGASELYEVKLLIVGEGETGKTTLWNLLQDPTYPVPNPDQKSTIGIQIEEGWSFQHLDDPAQRFLVNLWDFGGQDIQYMTHQFFLTRRSFYVLLADGRREVANFPYWLQIIELLGCDPGKEAPLPVLVVLNEKGNPIAKMPYDPETVKADYKKLNIIKREVDFAVKEDGRIEALTTTIKDLLCHQVDHLPLTIPAYWNEVREALYELRKTRNHIDADTFEGVCSDKGIVAQQQQDDLSQLLHDLGIILHFREDIDLADFIILNPQWAVNAIYEIMRHEKVKKENQGRFDQTLLQKIWTEKGYTKAEQGKLLNLMLKDNLEVCFKAKEGRKTIYITPQLLPEAKPPGLRWAVTPETLRYIYHYPFMPKGIIGRLIVRLHENIESEEHKKVVWENGMILKKEGCRAQVQCLEEKATGRQLIKMEIQGGTTENRKNVLRDIRNELRHIHQRSFPALKVYQKVPCNCEACKDSITPFEHDFDFLQKNKDKDGAVAQCLATSNLVPIQQLLDGVFREEDLFQRSGLSEKEANAQPVIHNNIYLTQEQQNVTKETTKIEVQGSTASPNNGTPYKYWWVSRLLVAIVAGLVLAYFTKQYLAFNFFDTWLAGTTIIGLILLARNPRRIYLRAAYYVLGLLGLINILPQIDLMIKTKDWGLQLGIEDEPLLSLGLLALAGFLFYQDYRVNK